MDSSASRLPPVDLARARQLWGDYVLWAGGGGLRPEVLPVVDYFGDSPALADALLRAVSDGDKRATSSLENEYTASGEPLPEAGAYWLACDSTGTARLILQTTEVTLAAFDHVDADFAFAEGEDDRSLASWRREHEKYWRRTQRVAGHQWDPTLTSQPGFRVVLERFVVAWPMGPGRA
ncbi:ASCH domain-containing protein [Glutamicibacter creatinolyticus]|uniref:ASCH domain-containing protein n=1 Tax=Glutamicibacter creatinolyticus TaxID=162496 RepID=UPI0006CF8533